VTEDQSKTKIPLVDFISCVCSFLHILFPIRFLGWSF
jgi:hypothetical protein